MTSETKSYAASTRKLSRARAQGDIVHSVFVGQAIALAALSWGLSVLGPRVSELWAETWRAALSALSAEPGRSLRAVTTPLARGVASFLALLAAPFVVVWLASLAQRMFVRPEPEVWPRGSLLSRALPFWSRDHWLEQALGVARLVLLLSACALLLRPSLPGLLDLWRSPERQALEASLRVLSALAARAAALLAIFAAIEIIYRAIRRRARLRMTRRELEQERRETEGDPHLAGERRRRQRALVDESGLAELSRASVVVHVASQRAVALRFAPAEQGVPVVWVKGRGELAARLVAQARLHGLVVCEDLTLVAALERLELTEAVPSTLHAPIAAHVARERA